jgi:RNA polymerase sigma-70 factor (ECF subfamily)
MYAICLRYTRDPDEAKDLLHDGFIKLFEKLLKAEDIDNVMAWMSRLFINHCLDYVRSAYKKYIVYLGDSESEPITDEEPELGESEYLNGYTPDMIIKAMNKMRDDYRVILNLYAVENYSHQEIADHLGIRDTTSRTKLMRARKQLKKILEGALSGK